MPKTKRENEPPAIIELLLPLAGLLLVGVFFLPGFRRLLGLFLFFSVGLGALSLVLGMALHFRHMKRMRENDRERPPAPVGPPDTWTLELLGQLEWKRFEELVAAYSHELGFTSATGDNTTNGQALRLFKAGRPEPAMLVQIKAWDPGTIGVEPVRELQAAMAAKEVSYGAFYTAGEFSSEAEEFARGKVIDLVNRREFLLRLQQLAPALQRKLLEETTAGDFTTPTCPGCDIKMVLLTEEGEPIGDGQTWVCRNRPQCQRSLPVV